MPSNLDGASLAQYMAARAGDRRNINIALYQGSKKSLPTPCGRNLFSLKQQKKRSAQSVIVM